MPVQLLVRKDRLHETRIQTLPDTDAGPGQIRVRIGPFALTANNITYAAFGGAMHYWDFYPTGEDGWGIVPVWGFATVVQSAHPEVAVGERLYGFYPMAESVLLTPVRPSSTGFLEGAAHREKLPRIYNQLQRCSTDPFYTPQTEPIQALLRPLYTTAWLIDDFLADKDFFGARTVIISSASSKTAMATAQALSRRKGLELVGLTSAAHQAFCAGLGCYARVLAYDALEQLGAPDTPCVYVDFSGNAAMRRALHTRQTGLRFSSAIGGTHLTELSTARDLPGPPPTLFFAPAQAARRLADWGGDALQQRLLAGWQDFLAVASAPAHPWLVVQQDQGTAAVQAAWQQVLAGQGSAQLGRVLQF